jgi:hypothetical protein
VTIQRGTGQVNCLRHRDGAWKEGC